MTHYKIPTVLHKTEQQECDDCGMINAIWASISHGTILCDECASAHRNLGRHVSQVRCLKASIAWPPNLLNMLLEMSSSKQTNRMLESGLLVAGNSNKPCAFDDYETKLNFIRQKYELLAFAKRISTQERKRLNYQLRRAVHTNDIMSSFWYLLGGADPNWKETEEIVSTALCDSAALGRNSILELLCIWGGDLSNTDLQYIARSRGHNELAIRINELEMELVNRILEFVARRHRRVDLLDWQSNLTRSKNGRMELQQLPCTYFAELLKDIYDEIERRDTNQLIVLLADWQRHSNESLGRQSQDKISVPFLPVIPYLSATRNQGRQKLARFSTIDFYLFLIDVVADLKRRKYGERTQLQKIENSRSIDTQSNEDPLYDHVASENDDSDVIMSKELKLRVMRLESQLKQLTCINEELRHQMSSLRHQLIGVFQDPQSSTYKQYVTPSNNIENQVSRISQNMESDYDNAATVFKGGEERFVPAFCAESIPTSKPPSTVQNILKDDINQFNVNNQSQVISVEDAIMKVIRRIGELHELIKRKQRSDYQTTSNDVVTAVQELCECARITSRAASNLVTDLDSHSKKLLSLNSSLQNNYNQLEHDIIDCCYQIGYCTKSLVALLSPSESLSKKEHNQDIPSADTLL